MAKAVPRPAGSWVYVLKADRTLELPQQSRFVLRPLSGAERDAVTDSLAITRTTPQGVETFRRMRQEARKLCVSHIASVEQFPSDAPVSWPETPAERATYLEMLDDDDVFEIGNAIYEHSIMAGPGDTAVSPTLPPAVTSSSGGPLAAQSSTIAPPANAIPA